ncbi:hypothetical protein [Actinoplanes regularis]|uniref:Uncharacterized protein n=1 Tax=Actinoplanes regularis TaxID=52697 RepID=A0A239HG06_9ACTN|nr:hypothetical protein [Actinoplanes regularis]GIE91036.1 hypothetical protein Are01nite_75160 [Actinoplanes regularis]SNS80081.1 hypothetical protein SAMN06264365_12475 [Actinoplanes regularis]
MMMHSDLMLALANDRRRELITEAERAHVLASALRGRRPKKDFAVRGQRAGSLASPKPGAVVPAR